MTISKVFWFAPIVLLAAFVPLAVQKTYAQTITANNPDIQTYSTATSSTVIITAPSGYKSEVITTYDGNQFHTFATTTPLTSKDIQGIKTNLQNEEIDMENFFQEQEALFKQQEQMLQSMWSNWGL
jgi:hypothetical protein